MILRLHAVLLWLGTVLGIACLAPLAVIAAVDDAMMRQAGYTAPAGDGTRPPLPTTGSGVMPARDLAPCPAPPIDDTMTVQGLRAVGADRGEGRVVYPVTIYQLTWGHSGEPAQRRYFHCLYASDACVRFAEQVLAFDRDPQIGAAHVSLMRLPDSIFPDGMHLMAWTKTSDERPTKVGTPTVEAAFTYEHV